MRLSPHVVGREMAATPVTTSRIPNPDRETDPNTPKTTVVRQPSEGYLERDALARWPHSLRDGSRDRCVPIAVDTH